MSSMGGKKHWLLTFSLHCLCSSTSHLFTSRLRLVYWSTLKIANDLPTFVSYYALVIVSLTWLAYFLSHDYLSYKFTRFFIYFLFLSDEGPMLETLDYNIRIGSTPTFLYFDLYLYSAYAAHHVYLYEIIFNLLYGMQYNHAWSGVDQLQQLQPLELKRLENTNEKYNVNDGNNIAVKMW